MRSIFGFYCLYAQLRLSFRPSLDSFRDYPSYVDRRVSLVGCVLMLPPRPFRVDGWMDFLFFAISFEFLAWMDVLVLFTSRCLVIAKGIFASRLEWL